MTKQNNTLHTFYTDSKYSVLECQGTEPTKDSLKCCEYYFGECASIKHVSVKKG